MAHHEKYAPRNMDITVVIPVYNRAHCLLATLQSVPEDYKIIVVDNGSTDGSDEVAARFCAGRRDARFTIAAQRGASAARNHGLALCRTEWVYFFDSDDEFTRLPAVNNFVGRELDMLCFPVRMVVGGKEQVRNYRPVADAATHVLSAMLGTQSMLFRTEWLRSIGGWNERCLIWNDWELGLRALLSRPRLCWATAEACHRIKVHPDSITGPSYSARIEAIRTTLAEAYTLAHKADDRRVLHALDLRLGIVCGRLCREGSPAAADTLRPLAHRFRPAARLLERYTASGHRGAWRLALAAVALCHPRCLSTKTI